jgi:hypothetical protein
MAIHPAKDAELHATPPQDAGTQRKPKTTPAKSGKTKGETTMMKKIGALVFAIVMIAMVGVAGAAGNTPTSDNDANAPAITVTSSATVTVPITKDVILFNVDGSSILEPNVTFSYSVEPVTVTDGTHVTGLTARTDDEATATATVAVRSGIAGGVTIKGNGEGATAGNTANVVFGTDNSTKINTWKETETPDHTRTKLASKNLDIIMNATTIYASGANTAGIYRYKITDTTTDETLLKAGIKRNADYMESLYLDVYTKYNSTNDGLEVYGYVLFKDLSNNASQNFEYDTTVAHETIKVSGFNVESETGNTGTYDGNTGIISDQYHTYNVLVKKTITGAMANVNNQFPFKVEVTNVASTITGYTQQITSQADFYYVATQNGTAGSETIVALDATGNWTLGDTTTNSALKFKNNDQILITGLPVNALIKVTELNNTVDYYNASAVETDSNSLTLTDGTTTGTVISMLPNSGTAGMNATFAIDNTSAKDQIVFTNTLEQISPTGYVARFAPYALILVAGIALLIIAKKRKPAKEEE